MSKYRTRHDCRHQASGHLQQRLWLLLLLVSVFKAASLPADADKSLQTRAAIGVQNGYYRRLHALCIGINNYQHPAVPDLNYAENDARAIAAILKDDYGFDDFYHRCGV